MFIHKSVLMHDVHVETPDPLFGQKLLEQYGGATGELTAALTYWTQSFHVDNPGVRDMLQDIGTEELSHLEIVAMLIEQHTAPGSGNLKDRVYESTLFSIRGPGPHLVDARGSFWDARYVNEGGHLARDLRSNVAAEAGALTTYEALLQYAPDEGTRQALNFLGTREVAHTHMFMEALRSINALNQPIFGNLQPDETVNLYFNMSSGPDAELRGPWNSEPAFRYVADPLRGAIQRNGDNTSASNEMLNRPPQNPPGTGAPPAHPVQPVPPTMGSQASSQINTANAPNRKAP